MWKVSLTVLMLASLVASTSSRADDANSSPSEVLLVRGCIMAYQRSTTLGNFTGHGLATSKLESLSVKRGDRVKAGQVIGHLFNRDTLAEQAAGKAAVLGAKLDIQQAEAQLNLEKQKLIRLQQIDQRRALLVSAQDMQVQAIAVRVADIAVLKTTQLARQAEAQLSLVEATLAARDLVAPHDGVVMEIMTRPGEALMTAKPILRIVDTDHIEVCGLIDVRDSWRVREGQTVRVVPELAGGKLPISHDVFGGRIVFLEREIDPETRACKVFASIPNVDGLLRSGLDCRMEISLNSAPTPTPSVKPAQAPVTPRPVAAPVNNPANAVKGAEEKRAATNGAAPKAPTSARSEAAPATRRTSGG